MPKRKSIQTVLGQEGSGFGAVAGSLFARGDRQSKRRALEAIAWEGFFQFLRSKKQNLRTNLDKKLNNLQSTFKPLVKGYEDVYRNEILPIFDRDRKWKNNPNFFYQEAQKDIAGPELGLDLKGLTKDDLDLAGKEALEKLTLAMAKDKERYHLQQMDNPLFQFRSAPEFTKVIRDDYAAQVNKEVEDPANIRPMASFLKRIDKEFGSREEHRANLQAGVDRAWTNRHIFEEDIKALRNVPGVTVGDTSYLDDVVFKKDVPINWEQLAGDTADIAKNIDASIKGEEGGTLEGLNLRFYEWDGKLALPRGSAQELLSPSIGPYRPFRSEKYIREAKDPIGTITAGRGIDQESFSVMEIVGRNNNGTFQFEEKDMTGTTIGAEMATSIATIVLENQRKDKEAAETLMKQGYSEIQALAQSGYRTFRQHIDDAVKTAVLTGNLRINDDEASFTFIPLTKESDITKQLPQEHWWAGKLNNTLFEKKLAQGADAQDLLDLALDQEEYDTNQILLENQNNPAFAEQEQEELYNRLDIISDLDESTYAAELIKFLIKPAYFGADDIKGQPVKLTDKEGNTQKIYTIGSLTQSEITELYENYYENFGKRNAELEVFITSDSFTPATTTTSDLIKTPELNITSSTERDAIQRLKNYAIGRSYGEERIKDSLISLGLDPELSRQEIKEILISQNIL